MKRIFLISLMIFQYTILATAQVITGTYAIQNVKTGKNLRPYEAGRQDGNKIVLYDHIEWKCMTWDFINIKDNTYQLRNLFTSKTFQPSGNPKAGCTLNQQAIVPGSQNQEWDFIPADDKSFNIRLRGTEFYITIADPAGKTNSDIILQPRQNSDAQLWKLVKQNPDF